MVVLLYLNSLHDRWRDHGISNTIARYLRLRGYLFLVYVNMITSLNSISFRIRQIKKGIILYLADWLGTNYFDIKECWDRIGEK